MESANRRGRAQAEATRETDFDKRIILAVNIDFSNIIVRFGVAPVVRTRAAATGSQEIIILGDVVSRRARSTGCRRSSRSEEFHMQYLLMIYRSEAELGKMDAAARKEMTAEYGAFTQSIIQSGHFKAGDGLQPSTTATTVRVRDGKTLTTDGPFAETREQLGGYYLVEAKDLDTALAIAARIPGAKTGSIEVRPVMVYD